MVLKWVFEMQDGVDSSGLGQGQVKGSYERGDKQGSVIYLEIHQQLSDCCLFKDSAPWS
jgi:hypothetical protein